MGSIPDHFSKVSIAKKRVTHFFFFGFLVHIKVMLDYSVVYEVCSSITSEINNEHTLIKNTLLLKNANHSLSLQPAGDLLLVEGLTSMSMAAD